MQELVFRTVVLFLKYLKNDIIQTESGQIWRGIFGRFVSV